MYSSPKSVVRGPLPRTKDQDDNRRESRDKSQTRHRLPHHGATFEKSSRPAPALGEEDRQDFFCRLRTTIATMVPGQSPRPVERDGTRRNVFDDSPPSSIECGRQPCRDLQGFAVFLILFCVAWIAGASPRRLARGRADRITLLQRSGIRACVQVDPRSPFRSSKRLRPSRMGARNPSIVDR